MPVNPLRAALRSLSALGKMFGGDGEVTWEGFLCTARARLPGGRFFRLDMSDAYSAHLPQPDSSVLMERLRSDTSSSVRAELAADVIAGGIAAGPLLDCLEDEGRLDDAVLGVRGKAAEMADLLMRIREEYMRLEVAYSFSLAALADLTREGVRLVTSLEALDGR